MIPQDTVLDWIQEAVEKDDTAVIEMIDWNYFLGLFINGGNLFC